MEDPFDLHRFVEAQSVEYNSILGELEAGSKQGHWMWYIFPQISGLGSSSMSQRFAISSLSEAQAYLEHSTLGGRLQECTRIVLTANRSSADEIFGQIDALKFRSCMTLFSKCSKNSTIFRLALEHFFNGEADARTLQILGA